MEQGHARETGGEKGKEEEGTEKAGQQSKKPNSFPTRTGPQAQKTKSF